MARMPTPPEQGATGDVPELDRAIPAPAGQRASIRAEREGPDHVSVSPPRAVQGQTARSPHQHFATGAGNSPIFPRVADGNCRYGIKGFGKESILEHGAGQVGILHVYALQLGLADR